MRFFNLAFAAAAIMAGGLVQSALVQSAWAQTQPRTAAETADRIERISRLSEFREHGARGFHTPRAMDLATSRRLGAAAERMSFGARDFHVRRQEVLGVGLNAASIEAAKELGFEVLRSFRLETLGIRVDVLRVPRGQSVRRALRRLRSADPSGAYEANSIFEPSGETGDFAMTAPLAPGATPDRGSARRLGIIDTGVDLSLAMFAHVAATQENFGRGEAVTPRAHGTAIAALAHYYGAEELLIADTFSGDMAFADAESLARALDWMAAEGIDIINMSLAGPPNALLELAVERAVARGHVIVAAVGNEGPDVLPLFPAAYPEVIGVTAVDSENRIYARANRGEGVDVAALGVGVSPFGNGEKSLSGTSYATPLVSAYLARRLPQREAGAIESTMTLLAQAATDLGDPGVDPVFGAGLISPDAYWTASGGDAE